MLFRLAFTENGDINSLSNDNDRAINAMAFAVICSFTGLVSPSHYTRKNENLRKFKILIKVFSQNFNKKANRSTTTYSLQNIQKQFVWYIIEYTIGGGQNDIAMLYGETKRIGRFRTVAQYILSRWR